MFNTPSNRHFSRRQLLQLAIAAGITPCIPPFEAFSNRSSTSISTRPIPSSGEQIPIVGIGTWQTFDVGNNQTQRATLKEVLSTFIQLGGQVIDSSPMYGSSEQVVGDLAAALDLLDPLFMATKVWTTGEKAGIQQMQSSMQKMRSNPIDFCLLYTSPSPRD